MSLLSNVFKKDLLKLRGALMLWLVLLCIQSLLGIGGIKVAADNLMLQVILPQLGWLIKILQGLMVVILIPLLIQDDPLVGTTGFWFTRPIGRKQLFATKAFFVICVLVLLPLIAELIVFMVNGVLPKHILMAIPEIILEKTAFMMPFLVLATITPKFSRYALAGGIIFAAVVVWWILVIVLATLVPNGNKLMGFLYNYRAFANYTLGLSIGVVKRVFIIILGSAIIFDQYLTRNTRRTIIRVIIGFLVLIIFNNIWNVDFLKTVSQGSKETIAADAIRVDINPQQHALVTDNLRYRKVDLREKIISANVDIAGLGSGQFAILTDLNAKMEWPNAPLDSGYISMSSRELLAHAKFMKPLQAVLTNSRIVNPFTNQMVYKEIFRLNETWFNRYKNVPGVYKANAAFDIYKYQINFAIPLRQGEQGISGSEQVVIFDILHRDTGISVIVGEKKTNLLFDRREERINPYNIMRSSEFNNVYLIENKKRGEAFLAEATDTSMLNYDEMINARSRLFTRANRLDFIYINDRNSSLPKIDQEWLKDAELIRIDAVLIGDVKKILKFEDFVLPEKSTDPMPERDPFEDALKQQDEQMREWKEK